MKNHLFVKVLVVLMICTVFCAGVNAQNVFSKGDNNLNLGVGIGSVLGGTSGYSTTTPPVSVSYERGIIDELFDEKSSLGIGAYLGYAANRHDFGNGYDWKSSYTIIGARGALHYQLIDKLDTYGGLMLGYNVVSTSFSSDIRIGTAPQNALGWSLFLGGRYYFTDNIGAFAELGYGIAYLQLGVSFKF